MTVQRCLLAVMVSVSIATCWSRSLPSSLSKNFFSSAGNGLTSEHGLLSGSSAIHFINPFLPLPISAAGAPLPPPPMLPPRSPVFRLPLKIFSNAKPIGIFQGFRRKAFSPIDNFFPHTVSNVIRLPLKYISNTKPIGVYFNLI